jgi:signal transduction histidine kinase
MVKYGNVTNVEIEFAPKKDFLKIGIVDDGISFNFKENLAKPNASGLKNINSRLHAVGGVIIQQETEKGNYFTITLKNIKDA